MAIGNKQAFLFLAVACSAFAICTANKNFGGWNSGYNSSEWPYYEPHNATQETNRIVVGGSENWRFGYNYEDWAWQHGPFYFNDTLVFKYDLPNSTYGHSVYLLPNYWSFSKCNFRRAKRIANLTQGSGEGFEFVLKRWGPHYFACGEHNAIHCKNGMKFSVWPIMRWNY